MTVGMTISAVLFDFDGTLVESLDVKITAFSTLYARYGADVERAAVAHYRANTGVSRLKRIRHCHEHILGEVPSDELVHELGKQFGAMVEHKVVMSPWVPGARDFLERHYETMNLFITSATPHAELQRIVAEREMGRYFQDVFGSPPDKMALIQTIVTARDFDRQAVVMVGDGRADYDAAVANGVRFVGRVPPGDANPFPADAVIIADLNGLDDHI